MKATPLVALDRFGNGSVCFRLVCYYRHATVTCLIHFLPYVPEVNRNESTCTRLRALPGPSLPCLLLPSGASRVAVGASLRDELRRVPLHLSPPQCCRAGV